MRRRDFLMTAATATATLCASCASIGHQSPAKPRSMDVILWCWDARMTWDDEPDKISTKMAASEVPFPYLKRSESYLVGFKRLVDYCSKNGVKGIVIWGFLRDAHGGVAAAKELCAYAKDHGVAILPGVGLCSYGGYYFDGDHPFNLNTYLKKHPDRISKAFEEGGKREVTPVLDPSLKANQTWWKDGLEWMLENFAIGGIDYEMGDFIVNPSPGAVKARESLGIKGDGNILDAIVATQDVMDFACKQKRDGIFINCTYRGLERITGFPDLRYLDVINKKTVWEYTLTHTAKREDFPTAFTGIPPHRMYGYLHWFNPSTKTMEKDYVADIARVFPGAASLGFEFIGTYGEVSAVGSALADRNYRAQVAWAKKPEMRIEEFA